ncbi:MAG TPA: hypothetical protein VH985_20215 [Candidatus Binatia bacterium]
MYASNAQLIVSKGKQSPVSESGIIDHGGFRVSKSEAMISSSKRPRAIPFLQALFQLLCCHPIFERLPAVNEQHRHLIAELCSQWRRSIHVDFLHLDWNFCCDFSHDLFHLVAQATALA